MNFFEIISYCKRWCGQGGKPQPGVWVPKARNAAEGVPYRSRNNGRLMFVVRQADHDHEYMVGGISRLKPELQQTGQFTPYAASMETA